MTDDHDASLDPDVSGVPVRRLQDRPPGARRPRRSGRSRLTAARQDKLLSGSAALAGNTVILGVLGLAFSVLAARLYAPRDLGIFAGVSAGSQLLGTISALGWSLTFVRFLPEEPSPRPFMVLMTSTIAAASLGLVAILTIILARPAFDVLHFHLSGGVPLAALFVLVLSTALGGVVTPGLVSRGRNVELLAGNSLGAVLRLALLAPLSFLGVRGLLVAYALGTGLALIACWAFLWRSIPAGAGYRDLARRTAGYARYSAIGYASSVFGIAALSIVPLVALSGLGPTREAYFVIGLTITTAVVLVPSTVAQALFIESAGRLASGNARRALLGIYALFTPACLVIFLFAHELLSAFGPAYAAHGTLGLRLLALGALPLGATYVVDAVFASTDRMRAYLLINGLSAALLVGFVFVGARSGVSAVSVSWGAANLAALAIGVFMLWFLSARRVHNSARHHELPS
jgi:O-antigen/teichoic acid export membrane protein